MRVNGLLGNWWLDREREKLESNYINNIDVLYFQINLQNKRFPLICLTSQKFSFFLSYFTQECFHVSHISQFWVKKTKQLYVYVKAEKVECSPMSTEFKCLQCLCKPLSIIIWILFVPESAPGDSEIIWHKTDQKVASE